MTHNILSSVPSTRRHRWAGLAALLTFGVLASGCASSGTTSESAPSTTTFDVKTTTCAQYSAYSDNDEHAAAQTMLSIMAQNEGITVTTDIHNAFVVQLNNACDQNPTSLLALAASSAYVAATGG